MVTCVWTHQLDCICDSSKGMGRWVRTAWGHPLTEQYVTLKDFQNGMFRKCSSFFFLLWPGSSSCGCFGAMKCCSAHRDLGQTCSGGGGRREAGGRGREAQKVWTDDWKNFHYFYTWLRHWRFELNPRWPHLTPNQSPVCFHCRSAEAKRSI